MGELVPSKFLKHKKSTPEGPTITLKPYKEIIPFNIIQKIIFFVEK